MFCSRYVLNYDENVSFMGSVSWRLSLCLFAAWFIVFLCVAGRVKFSGKVVYFYGTISVRYVVNFSRIRCVFTWCRRWRLLLFSSQFYPFNKFRGVFLFVIGHSFKQNFLGLECFIRSINVPFEIIIFIYF